MSRQSSVPPTNLPMETVDVLAEMHALRAKHAAEHGNDAEAITHDLIAGYLKDRPNARLAEIAPAVRRSHARP